VRVGEEIIEYSVRQGNTLKQLRRGARMTTAAEHQSGETVVPWGYTCHFNRDLLPGPRNACGTHRKESVTKTTSWWPSLRPTTLLSRTTRARLRADAPTFRRRATFSPAQNHL